MRLLLTDLFCILLDTILYLGPTLRSLLDERSILSEQGSIFLENQLSEQAELSKQGGIIL